MRTAILAVLLVTAAACSRGENYESGGTVDTVVNNQDTTRGGIDVNFGTTRDTLNMPIIGTEKDTIIIDKPVVKGRRPVEVKRPTVDVNRKP